MNTGYTVPLVPCARPDCPATYKDHRWGHSRAQAAGWFLQQDGTAWCPEHVPEWVAGWRARRGR